ARVHAGGYVAGISPGGFYALLLYPLTPRGAWVNLTTMARSSLLNHSHLTTVVRVVCLLTVAALLYWAGGWKGVLFGWLVPLLTSYPVFAWVSLLTEHRWFVEGTSRDRRDLEYLAGRPTDYFGLTGWLIRVFIAPTSDAYHLAHSLYPGVRWNYLP
ncbi:fatty acid desaturase, partial [Pseudomonas viridiflava]